MRLSIPPHHLSIDPAAEWIADAMDPQAVELQGAYFRSVAHALHLDVRRRAAGGPPLTAAGLHAMRRAQEWGASPPFMGRVGQASITASQATPHSAAARKPRLTKEKRPRTVR